ncbi:AcrR family transcriptional regulator [Nocardioides marinisabuli]|uniref:AcrR family transcriptional regulator n=1 Tax=Nocardioides marinisabuli TaxID=419476 RepID=A0A7Y9JNF7_9ACTN|nr:TetR/AcrR family transcriptional regulator [Nocardioides marinisabuli]NYD55837.1 AcrR family transcriptional regulator [Nocardioides marinisabuli]
MGHHGWKGDPPPTEALARARILEGARRCLERTGAAKTTLSDVAQEVGVTRQTVYRYFPGLADLLQAVAEAGAAAFVERMRAQVAAIPTPAEVVCEAIAFCVEELPREPHIAPLLDADDRALFGHGVTSGTGVDLAGSFLRDLDIDWTLAGVADRELDELAELMLRLIGSLLQHPPGSPRSPDDVRRFVRRWLGPALIPGLDR